MYKSQRIFVKSTSLVLAFILALCPLSLYSVAHATETFAVGLGSELIEDVIIEIIWETLKGWGIRIYENASEELNENIRQILSGDIFEYLTDELHEGFDQWITGLNWYYDNFGRRMVNPFGLDIIYAFSLWLQAKYGYTDNDTVYISPTFSIDDITIYQFPVTGFRYIDGSDRPVIFQLNNNNNPGLYWIPMYFSSGRQGLTLISLSNSNSNYSMTYVDTNENYGNHGFSMALNYTFVNGNKVYTRPWYINNTSITDSESDIYTFGAEYSRDEIALSLGNSQVETSGVYVETDTIVYPPDDPLWEDGMSIIYYPDGSIGYIAINWPDSVSVDNLPAIVSIGSIPNPGFADVFLPLRAFVNTFTDGMAVIKDVVFHLPTEALAIFYAIMSITVIFGALHMFKEH